MKILCVHGVGHHDPLDDTWMATWRNGVRSAVQAVGGAVPDVAFCMHDVLFNQERLTLFETAAAIATLGGNALWGTGQRGLFDGDNTIGWTAGMLTQWAGNPNLRAQARQLLADEIKKHQPDVIAAHSLGSLIAYDLFSGNNGREISDGQTLLTFGSQINSRFIAGIFQNGVMPLPAAAHWYHVFNPNDHVFIAKIRFDGAVNFQQVITRSFGGWSPTRGHTDIQSYLNDAGVLAQVWKPIVDARAVLDTTPRHISLPVALREMSPVMSSVTGMAAAPIAPVVTRRPQRALLVGINEYVDPEIGLEGCVNDVFQVSAVLQECGVEPDDIRVVLDGRATADAIRQRLGWLFDDVQPGDTRFLYFSGHGIQMPVFGADEKPDRMIEALVAADYNGTLQNCITDSDLSAYYTNLPRDCHVIIALDCCHAGGLTRNGGPRVRGIDPPDDIRHRMLVWNKDAKMWELRKVAPLIPVSDSDSAADAADKSVATKAAERKELLKENKWRKEFTGESGCVVRLGAAINQRRLNNEEYDALKAETGWKGAFMPMMLLACEETEKSYEYLHGAVSYGAFTFAFCRTLQWAQDSKAGISYLDAIERTRKTLKKLGYQQTPLVIGPETLKTEKIPFSGVEAARAGKSSKSRKKSSSEPGADQGAMT